MYYTVDYVNHNQAYNQLKSSSRHTFTVCRGLLQKEVNSSEDVLTLMKQAAQSKRIGETKMNKQSSRSHCIFTVNVQATVMTNDGTVPMLGKLHMVDLAGSECAKTASLGSRQSAVSDIYDHLM